MGNVGWKYLWPLGKVLTYQNLIYFLNFPFDCVITSRLVDKCKAGLTGVGLMCPTPPLIQYRRKGRKTEIRPKDSR